MEHRELIDDYDKTLSISNIGADKLFTLTMCYGQNCCSFDIDMDQLDEMIRVLLEIQEES